MYQHPQLLELIAAETIVPYSGDLGARKFGSFAISPSTTVLKGLAEHAVYDQRQEQKNEHVIDGHLKQGKSAGDEEQRVLPRDIIEEIRTKKNERRKEDNRYIGGTLFPSFKHSPYISTLNNCASTSDSETYWQLSKTRD